MLAIEQAGQRGQLLVIGESGVEVDLDPVAQSFLETLSNQAQLVNTSGHKKNWTRERTVHLLEELKAVLPDIAVVQLDGRVLVLQDELDRFVVVDSIGRAYYELTSLV